MQKKGQAAMEFLMTYGWAILVVIVAIGALAYFGVLNPDKLMPRSCTITPGIGCDDFKADSADNSIRLVMRNGMGESLSAVTVSVSGCTEDTAADGDDVFADTANLDVTLTNCPAMNQNDRLKKEVLLSYTSAAGIDHTISGLIVGRVE